MRSVESLLDNLIAQAAMDQDQGLEEWSVKTIAIRDRIVKQFEEAQDNAERGRPAPAEVRSVPGRQDPTGEVRGPDLSALRRVAADPGAAGDAAKEHYIVISAAAIAVPMGTGSGHGPLWVAQFELWACGPCRTQGYGLTLQERNCQIAQHMAG